MKPKPFEIIPVIDVRHGVAVRAVAGDRANYQPLETPLAASPDPVAVALGYRRLHPFPTLYVADLDAIEGRSGNGEFLANLGAELPGLNIWFDNGSAEAAGIRQQLENTQVSPVFGSESNLGASEMQNLVERFGGRIILSLDFQGDAFSGTRKLLADATCWPSRVIVMTLGRVGTGCGPDLERIADIAQRAGNARRVYAAGGVRNCEDLIAVRQAGAAGALVASALHGGQIKTGGLD